MDMSRGKTIMYFDNSNIFYSQIAAGWRIDVKKFMKNLSRRGEIWQTHFFAAVTEPPRYMQTKFYELLKRDLHWEMTILPLGKKTIKCKKCNALCTGYKEKGVDVALATKMLIHAINKAYETAILVSGDKDYFETVKYIKNMGLHVEVVSFKSSLSKDLEIESSLPALLLDDIRGDIELTKPVDLEHEQYLHNDE